MRYIHATICDAIPSGTISGRRIPSGRRNHVRPPVHAAMVQLNRNASRYSVGHNIINVKSRNGKSSRYGTTNVGTKGTYLSTGPGSRVIEGVRLLIMMYKLMPARPTSKSAIDTTSDIQCRWTYRESNSRLCNANAPVYHLPIGPSEEQRGNLINLSPSD